MIRPHIQSEIDQTKAAMARLRDAVRMREPSAPSEMVTEHLLVLSDRYCGHTSRSEATISNQIAGHARLFSRLRQGHGCTVKTFAKAMLWFARNWPDDLEWPADVPHPQIKETTS